MRKYLAEMLGTFWLVFGGCGSAVFAAGVNLGIGYVGVSFAFGLTLLTMAYTIGRISGCHINPAVSVGLFLAGRMNAKDLPFYIIAQVIGGILAAGLLICILKGGPNGYDAAVSGLAANGFGEHSPEKYNMKSAFLIEFVLTFFFLIIILASTSKFSVAGFAPLPIGLSLVLIHLISIPITNTSVNPARSLGPAVYVGGWAMEQVWLFWLAPIAGAAVAGLVWRYFESE